MPLLVGCDGASYSGASDEHGRIDIVGSGGGLEIGEKVRLVPGHCDPTVNLHDWFICVRNSRVESIWPVSARGAVF